MNKNSNIILAICLITALTVSGCSAYVGSKQVTQISPLSADHGYIALYLNARWQPPHTKRPGYPKVGVILNRKGQIDLGINALQDSEPGLMIYPAKTGTYHPPRFLLNLDVRLSHRLRLDEFEVRAGEVTYIGDYHFPFYLEENARGTPVYSGFDVNIINNIDEREPEIRDRVKAMSSVIGESIVIRSPDIVLGRRR